MVRHPLVHIQTLAAEALHTRAAVTVAKYQHIERLLDQIITRREPECVRGVPPRARALLHTILPSAPAVDLVKSRLKWICALASRQDEQIVIYPPAQKSVYAVYEKLIDGRMKRCHGVSFRAKHERSLRFDQLIAELNRKGRLRVILNDVVRARLIASTPTSFQRLAAELPEYVAAVGCNIIETRIIGLVEKNGVLHFPGTLAIPKYLAIHFKIIPEHHVSYGMELQLRIALNHWGPHMRKTTNGYLNKYLASAAECVDYSIDRISVNVVPRASTRT